MAENKEIVGGSAQLLLGNLRANEEDVIARLKITHLP